MVLPEIIILVALVGAPELAEPPPRPRFQIGVLPAKATPALKKPPTSHVLLAKAALTDRWAMRLGLDGQYSSASDAEKKIDIALGGELRDYPLPWVVVYIGVDLVFAATRFNNRPSRVDRYGLSPVGGVAWIPYDVVSVATEVRLDTSYTVFRDPDAFDRSRNSEQWEVAIGGVGSLYLNVHF